MPAVRAGIATILALVLACVPARTGAIVQGPPAAPANGATEVLAAPDTGAPRVCVHDPKELAPCTEDCDRGIAFACAVVAARAELVKDLPRAVHVLERACELRDAASCVSASRMHANGRGVPPSHARQIQLLSVACILGDTHACSIPAKAFASGTDVPRDERRAAELWQRGCAGGDESACAQVESAAP